MAQTRTSRRIATLAIAATSLLLASSAWAAQIPVRASLTPAAAGNPGSTPVIGIADGMLDTSTGVLHLRSAVIGVDSGQLLETGEGESAYRIELGAGGGAGESLVIPLLSRWFDLEPDGMLEGIGNDHHGSVGDFIDPHAFLEFVLSENAYLNLHHVDFPNGVVRGKLLAANVPEPTTLALIALGLLGVLVSRRA